MISMRIKNPDAVKLALKKWLTNYKNKDAKELKSDSKFDFPKVIWMRMTQVQQIDAVKKFSNMLTDIGEKNVVNVPEVTKLPGWIETLKMKEPINPLQPITITIDGEIAFEFFNPESSFYRDGKIIVHQFGNQKKK